jgi:hypothetical protein
MIDFSITAFVWMWCTYVNCWLHCRYYRLSRFGDVALAMIMSVGFWWASLPVWLMVVLLKPSSFKKD